MSSREDYHGVRSGDKRKAENDEAKMGVAPKLPKTSSEKEKCVLASVLRTRPPHTNNNSTYSLSRCLFPLSLPVSPSLPSPL